MIMTKYKKTCCFSVLIINLGLTGCASLYNIKSMRTPQYQTPREVDDEFKVSGRFLAKNSVKNNYGNFIWDRSKTKEEIKFNTPLGQTVAKVIIKDKIASLIVKNKTYIGSDLDDMMEENLGFTLPLTYLHYWIQGLSIPDQEISDKLDTGFKQLGWTIEYLDWHNQNYPKIIQCTKDDLVIKLLINK